VKVLVTGGAGYIGSHTCKALAKRGIVPVVFDNMAFGHPWAVQWGPLYQGDILDSNRLAEVFKREKIEAVFHFAAFAYVGESTKDPLKYYHNNVLGSIRLIETMKEAGVRKLIFSSTCATYGNPKQTPILENFEQAPINPYGHSKLIVEKILADCAKTGDISVTALRYFNASGADPELDIGEDHLPETHLIPLTLDAAFGRRKSITVFGSDYQTPDGTCVRDYIHVSDLAEAHVLAFEKMPASGFRAFNLGTGQGASVRDVIQAVEKHVGQKVPVEEGQRREGDSPVLVASDRLARQELGWEPKSSTLENIVVTAARWHEKHFLQQQSTWKRKS
jgi:UDP-arabinose 4-epimerase